MGEPARKPEYDDYGGIEPDIKPDLRAINGGGQSTPERASLRSVGRQEETPDKIERDKPVGEREEEPSFRNRVTSDYGGYKSSRGRKLTSTNVRAVLKKRGPLGLLISLIIGGGGFGFLGVQAFLPIHVIENFMSRNDTQNTSMTIRTNKILAMKMTDDTTSGLCKTAVTFACRYSRPSNKLLKSLSKQGIEAFDNLEAKGDPISKRFLLANERPKSYRFTPKSGGKPITVSAKDFYSTLQSNAEFRAAFHDAYNPRFIGYADSVFQAIKARFSFKTSDTLASAKNAEEANTKLNETVAGEDVGANKAIASGVESEAEAVIEKPLVEEAKHEIAAVAKSGRGNAVGLVAGAACLIGDAPNLVIKTARAYQMAPLIKLAATFITTAYAIKAGVATPEEVAVLGNMLTSVYNGKSAMGSFGMKNILFGDTKTENNNYKKFSPGISAINALGGIASVTSSKAKTEACRVATNPATGATVDLVTSETVVGPIINSVLGLVLSEAMAKILPKAIPSIMKWLTPYFSSLLSSFLPDLTQNLKGEPLGDAFASGALHMVGQTANARGNMPLSVDQAMAYQNTTNEVNLAYAQEDKATLSPLDASSPNTMLGSFVDKLIPYYSNMGSVSGALSTIGSIVSGSFSSILNLSKVSATTTDKSQFTMCEDPSITDDNIAAGPFCNIIYGIPPEYLDKDPAVVVSDLIASGDINGDTGETVDKSSAAADTGFVSQDTSAKPVGLKAWQDNCTDGTTAQAKNCEITDQVTADYALYTIDHSIQKTMDGEDPALDTPASDSTSATIDNSDSSIADITDYGTNSSTYTGGSSLFDTILSIITNYTAPKQSVAYSLPAPTDSLTLTDTLIYSLPPKRVEGITI